MQEKLKQSSVNIATNISFTKPAPKGIYVAQETVQHSPSALQLPSVPKFDSGVLSPNFHKQFLTLNLKCILHKPKSYTNTYYACFPSNVFTTGLQCRL
jgi:hypothetical protein